MPHHGQLSNYYFKSYECVSIIYTHGKRDSNAWVSSDPIPWLFLLASGAGEGSKQKWVALQSWTYLLKQFSQIVHVPFSSWLQAIRPVLSQADFHRHNKQEDTNKGLPGLLHSVREKNIFLIIMTFKAQFSSYRVTEMLHFGSESSVLILCTPVALCLHTSHSWIWSPSKCGLAH